MSVSSTAASVASFLASLPTTAVSGISGAFTSSVEQQAAPLMATLANAFGNAAVMSDTITKLQEIPGMPSLQISELQSLRAITDPNAFQAAVNNIDTALDTNSSTSGWSIAKAIAAL